MAARTASIFLYMLCPIVLAATPDAPKAPPPSISISSEFTARALSVEKLQAWYGDSLDLKNDAQLAKTAQSAEALIHAIFSSAEVGTRLSKERELNALALPPMTLRAIVRYGRIPNIEAKKGVLNAEAPVPGFKDKSIKLTVRIPDEYTIDRSWPVILALHGAHGDGPGYLEHWTHGPGAAVAGKYIVLAPSADKVYGWGPASFGRAQAIAALDWVIANYRVDADRVYMEGTSMGGYGTKRLATLWPDRFAAISPRSGPPLSPLQMATMRNLHALPMLSFAGRDDKLIPEKVFESEKDEITADGLPAEMNILSGRGHEVYQDKDPDAVAFFEKHPRDRAPASLTFDSCEEGPGVRHYYVEITETDSRGNQQASEIVLNGTKGDDSIIKQMQAARDIVQYEALLKQAQEKGVLLENRKTWSKPREITLHIDRANNSIVIEKTAFVRQFKIYVDDDLLDMSKEIVVKSGERTLLKRKIERSTHFMLDEMSKTGRRDMTYWGVLDIRL